MRLFTKERLQMEWEYMTRDERDLYVSVLQAEKERDMAGRDIMEPGSIALMAVFQHRVMLGMANVAALADRELPEASEKQMGLF